MKDVLEPFSDIGAPATACWCDCFEGSSRACDEHKAALVAEVRRLREEGDDYRKTVEYFDAQSRRRKAERDAARGKAERLRRVIDATARDTERYVADRLAESRAEAGRVREALQAVRALHRPENVQVGSVTHGGGPQYGQRCSRCGGHGWPCATVRALDAALDGAE